MSNDLRAPIKLIAGGDATDIRADTPSRRADATTALRFQTRRHVRVRHTGALSSTAWQPDVRWTFHIETTRTRGGAIIRLLR